MTKQESQAKADTDSLDLDALQKLADEANQPHSRTGTTVAAVHALPRLIAELRGLRSQLAAKDATIEKLRRCNQHPCGSIRCETYGCQA